jgi:lysophospholipase L1-like esterase
MLRSRCLFLFLATACGLVAAACGGGGGDGGFRLEDLNRDGTIFVIAFGDSITRGVGDGDSSRSTPAVETAGYPARLQQQLQLLDPGRSIVVQNQGQPGEETSRGVPRLADVLAANPTVDYVILLEGINDLLNDRDPDSILANLRTMVDRVYGAGAQPILGTLTPVCCDHANVVPNSDIASLDDRIHTLGRETSAPVVDFFEGFGGLAYDPAAGLLHQPEGLHPTPTGYDRMTEVVLAADPFH